MTQDQELISRTRSELAADSIGALVGNLKSLGLTGEQILDEVKRSLEERH